MKSASDKPRIMIVEDETIVACDLQSCLESFDYEVPLIACSGEQALRMASESSLDLVLMDIKLKGGLDGIEVAEKLRTDTGVPVVFLTANHDDAVVQRAKVTEPLAYLLKPYHPKDLRVAIEVALYKARIDREREQLRQELEQALAETRTLRGLIPLCAWCRKVRTDEGYWLSVEAYFERTTAGVCSHSICPDCQAKQAAAWTKRPQGGPANA